MNVYLRFLKVEDKTVLEDFNRVVPDTMQYFDRPDGVYVSFMQVVPKRADPIVNEEVTE